MAGILPGRTGSIMHPITSRRCMRRRCSLIQKGLAYVCELTPEQMRENRGDLTHPAVSPYRDRPIEESLDLFARMKAGEFEDGRMTLRAKIDLASGNFQHARPGDLPDQPLATHHRTGATVGAFIRCTILPTRSRTRLEGITHSLCTLEFEDHQAVVRLGD